MVERGRGRPKSSVSGDGAEFFKIFLPHLSSQQLLIPPDFLKDFKRTIKEKVILKDVCGKMWYIDVKETPDGVYLKNGWQNFVSYHSLQTGDFLVFQYDRCYSFVVKIFGTNGCKKEALVENIATDVKIEEETEEEMEAQQTSPKRACPHTEDHLLRGNERTRHSKSCRIGEVDELQEQNVASELPENCEELKNAEGVVPYFVSPPSQSRKFKLRIPDEVINKHNLHLEPEMILRNANGKEWPVRIYSLNNGPTFIGKGWLAFQNENNVGLEDSCKFTFETETLSRTINVQILRATPNISRTKRYL